MRRTPPYRFQIDLIMFISSEVLNQARGFTMGLAKLLFGTPEGSKEVEESYWDLGAAVQETGGEAIPAKMLVKVAEIRTFEDLKTFQNHVYEGNLLILDFSPVAKEEITLKRLTSELRKLVMDVGGDIAGMGKTYFIVTPAGVKVDRTKAVVAPK